MIYSQEWPFEVPSNLEDVSEPLKEYSVGYDDSLSLEREPWLLGIKVNGKWGWINKSGRFIIQAEYDEGFVTAYNGILILKKNGYYGGLYLSDFSKAFSFRYNQLVHAYKRTYVAFNSSRMCALVQPGDNMLTNYSYLGFSQYHQGSVTEFIKKGFWGNQVAGRIDLDTGREL